MLQTGLQNAERAIRIPYASQREVWEPQYKTKTKQKNTYCSPSGFLPSSAGGAASPSGISGNAGTANGTNGPAFSSFSSVWVVRGQRRLHDLVWYF